MSDIEQRTQLEVERGELKRRIMDVIASSLEDETLGGRTILLADFVIGTEIEIEAVDTRRPERDPIRFMVKIESLR